MHSLAWRWILLVSHPGKLVRLGAKSAVGTVTGLLCQGAVGQREGDECASCCSFLLRFHLLTLLWACCSASPENFLEKPQSPVHPLCLGLGDASRPGSAPCGVHEGWGYRELLLFLCRLLLSSLPIKEVPPGSVLHLLLFPQALLSARTISSTNSAVISIY